MPTGVGAATARIKGIGRGWRNWQEFWQSPVSRGDA